MLVAARLSAFAGMPFSDCRNSRAASRLKHSQYCSQSLPKCRIPVSCCRIRITRDHSQTNILPHRKRRKKTTLLDLRMTGADNGHSYFSCCRTSGFKSDLWMISAILDRAFPAPSLTVHSSCRRAICCRRWPDTQISPFVGSYDRLEASGWPLPTWSAQTLLYIETKKRCG